MSILHVNTIAPNNGDTVSISGSLSISGQLTIGDESTDTVAITAEISSSLIPDVDNTYDIGSNEQQWKNSYIRTSSIDLLNSTNVIAHATPESEITAFPSIPGGGTYSPSEDLTGRFTSSIAPISGVLENIRDGIGPSQRRLSGSTLVSGYHDVTFSGSNELTIDFLKEVNNYGVSRLIYTDINKDGMKTSPNFEGTEKIANTSNFPVIMSGGVSSIEDIKKAKGLKNIEGIIVGKAIYDGDIKLEELVKEDA